MMLRHALLGLLTATALFRAPQAGATVFCVASGPMLQSALNQAETNGQADEIRLKPGLYSATPLLAGEASFDYQSSEALLVYGSALDAGNNCTATRARPDQVVVSGINQHPVLRLVALNGATGSWSLGHLTISNGLSGGGRTGCLSMRAATGSAIQGTLTNLVIRQCVQDDASVGVTSALLGFVDSASSALRIVGNVLEANRSDAYSPVLLTGVSGAQISFHNNTVVNNWAQAASSDSIYYPVSTGGSVSVFMSNNVFHANRRGQQQLPADLEADTGFVMLQMDHNHINELAAGGVTDLFRSTGDPGFISDSNIRLRKNSPLRNSGNNSPLGGLTTLDADGRPRVQGGQVDRGAFEFDELLINGFE